MRKKDEEIEGGGGGGGLMEKGAQRGIKFLRQLRREGRGALWDLEGKG